ncbi:DNA internalization-related competence protein ComEC/Rec2 [Cellulosilyticum sp. I15G10I2]|uniref:DNA internalization-related competence protein ComEC/Rec2 n=1 Tax=Cellulosilyticum sp. I15G10I2 TaxID=1892843 RepID=UPI00085C8526|nr:DNA internalization-related competence protein ComEC/Rec2 [Cellulosilyticum sp. I15G10I2]
MKTIKRPMVEAISWSIAGMLGGQMYLEQIHLFPFFLIVIIAVIFMHYLRYNYKIILIFFILLFAGFLWTIGHTVIREQKILKVGQSVTLEGKVARVIKGKFNDTLTLEEVSVKYQNEYEAIKSKVNLIVPMNSQINPNDKMRAHGEVLPRTLKMNPSDMNYEKYLISQGIAATLKTVEIKKVNTNGFNMRFIMTQIDRQIEKLFQNNDQGIIQTLLTGNNENISEDIRQIYSKAGIGHVLAISGFHIALLMSIVYILLSYLGIPYISKFISMGSIIWLYAYLTGASTSTIRACIMATLIIISKCIWEEADQITNLALAALIILLINPFQLTQVGFQLSFAAVGSLLISQIIIKKLELDVSQGYLKFLYVCVPWLCVTLSIAPILAVHFYEIPLFCGLLNLIFVPIFSVIIIFSWISLGMSIITLTGAAFIAKIIIVLLDTIAFIGEKTLQMPLGTLCIGKPSLLGILIYYGLLCVLFGCIMGYIKKRVCLYIIIVFIGTSTLYEFVRPKTLDIAYLYVGQGDAIVMTTPHGKVIAVDAGNFGKGKVVERYIKYKGKKTITAFILSHSDADHVGGLIDLLDTDIKINNIFVSKLDESYLMSKLLKICLEKKINVYPMGYLDAFTIDNVDIVCLAPKGEQIAADNNNNSLGCLIQYKQFTGLFTGDMDQVKEQEMCSVLNAITVLKVGHHGSKTSTSEHALLKIKPRYAIISCGINNRYNHPHQSTLDTLSKYQAEVLRTDQRGAVELKTDGDRLLLRTQIRGGE